MEIGGAKRPGREISTNVRVCGDFKPQGKCGMLEALEPADLNPIEIGRLDVQRRTLSYPGHSVRNLVWPPATLSPPLFA